MYHKKIEKWMFKKIELWVLLIVIFAGIIFAFSFGVLVRQEIEGITKAGNIDISYLTKPAARIARLPEKLAYHIFKNNPFIVSDPWDEKRKFNDQTGFVGAPNFKESYILLSTYDGNLEDGKVELIDLTNFKVLHTWNPDINAFNDLVDNIEKFKYLNRDDHDSRKILMHPNLTNDFGLLFGWNAPIRKIDACSDLIFQNTHNRFHHSIELDVEGNIWAPTLMTPPSLPFEKVGNSFKDDAIVKMSAEGDIIFEKSVARIFIENGLEYLLFSIGGKGGNENFNTDPTHLNDIQPVDFDGNHWKKGDVFLSLRNLSMVLLYRPSTNEIIWKGTGPFSQQHDVDILDDHRISVFNNNTKIFKNGSVVNGNNEVIIYDFDTNEYSFYLKESLIENDVRTIYQGTCQILTNGDLFVEETLGGRTLYFNADGSLRWSHVNSADDGSLYHVGWSRILYTQDEIMLVKKFLGTKINCND